MRKILNALVLLATALSWQSNILWAAPKNDCPGLVVAVSGRVEEVNKDTKRLLARKSPVCVKDKIQSDPDGKAQIRMVDGTLINIGPSSSVIISEYHINGSANDAQVTTLESGTLRTLSGIGKAQRSVNTPVAVMALIGTDCLVGYNKQKASVAVLSGTIEVKTPGGAFEMNDQQELFVATIDANEKIEYASELPQEFEAMLTPAEEVKVSEETEEQANSEAEKTGVNSEQLAAEVEQEIREMEMALMDSVESETLEESFGSDNGAGLSVFDEPLTDVVERLEAAAADCDLKTNEEQAADPICAAADDTSAVADDATDDTDDDTDDDTADDDTADDTDDE